MWRIGALPLYPTKLQLFAEVSPTFDEAGKEQSVRIVNIQRGGFERQVCVTMVFGKYERVIKGRFFNMRKGGVTVMSNNEEILIPTLYFISCFLPA